MARRTRVGYSPMTGGANYTGDSFSLGVCRQRRRVEGRTGVSPRADARFARKAEPGDAGGFVV